MKDDPLRAMVWALLNDDIRAGVAELTASDSDRVIALLGLKSSFFSRYICACGAARYNKLSLSRQGPSVGSRPRST
jgi:hypothetical protein